MYPSWSLSTVAFLDEVYARDLEVPEDFLSNSNTVHLEPSSPEPLSREAA